MLPDPRFRAAVLDAMDPETRARYEADEPGLSATNDQSESHMRHILAHAHVVHRARVAGDGAGGIAASEALVDVVLDLDPGECASVLMLLALEAANGTRFTFATGADEPGSDPTG